MFVSIEIAEREYHITTPFLLAYAALPDRENEVRKFLTAGGKYIYSTLNDWTFDRKWHELLVGPTDNARGLLTGIYFVTVYKLKYNINQSTHS